MRLLIAKNWGLLKEFILNMPFSIFIKNKFIKKIIAFYSFLTLK